MNCQQRIGRQWQAMCCSILLLTLSGCSWLHHKRASSCRELTVVGQTKSNPPLRVPPGLDAPDTRNAIKVPELNEPEQPRLPTDPCLSRPPDFKVDKADAKS